MLKYNIQAVRNGNEIESFTGSAEEVEAFISDQERKDVIFQIVQDGMNEIFARVSDEVHNISDQFPDEQQATENAEKMLTEMFFRFINNRHLMEQED